MWTLQEVETKFPIVIDTGLHAAVNAVPGFAMLQAGHEVLIDTIPDFRKPTLVFHSSEVAEGIFLDAKILLGFFENSIPDAGFPNHLGRIRHISDD